MKPVALFLLCFVFGRSALAQTAVSLAPEDQDTLARIQTKESDEKKLVNQVLGLKMQGQAEYQLKGSAPDAQVLGNQIYRLNQKIQQVERLLEPMRYRVIQHLMEQNRDTVTSGERKLLSLIDQRKVSFAEHMDASQFDDALSDQRAVSQGEEELLNDLLTQSATVNLGVVSTSLSSPRDGNPKSADEQGKIDGSTGKVEALSPDLFIENGSGN